MCCSDCVVTFYIVLYCINGLRVVCVILMVGIRMVIFCSVSALQNCFFFLWKKRFDLRTYLAMAMDS